MEISGAELLVAKIEMFRYKILQRKVDIKTPINMGGGKRRNKSKINLGWGIL